MSDQSHEAQNQTLSLEDKKAMVGNVRFMTQIKELQEQKFLGSFTVEQFTEFPVSDDYPAEKDPDNRVRDWSPVIAITFNDTRLNNFGLKSSLAFDKAELEIFLTGFAQISAEALKNGIPQLDFETVFSSFRAQNNSSGKVEPKQSEIFDNRPDLQKLRKEYDDYVTKYRLTTSE